MKILLDENLPHALRHHFPGHDVFTVGYQGWSGKRNGELLRLAGDAGFDAMLTMDNGVAYQQNVHTLPVSIVILSAPTNDIDDLLPLVPAILSCLARLPSRSIARVP
jgi:predicted nuclease of predicted toxin-antitoxin system